MRAIERIDMTIRYAAGGVIIGPENKIVVVNQNHDSWSLPKGHIDLGETARQAAEREIQEESGITELEYISELGTYRRPRIPKSEHPIDPARVKEITMFLYRTNQAELMPEDPDNPEAIWVDVDNVSNLLTHQKDKEFFKSVIPTIQQQFDEL
jgi:8-oxo-dGTP diphosphatase